MTAKKSKTVEKTNKNTLICQQNEEGKLSFDEYTNIVKVNP